MYRLIEPNVPKFAFSSKVTRKVPIATFQGFLLSAGGSGALGR